MEHKAQVQCDGSTGVAKCVICKGVHATWRGRTAGGMEFLCWGCEWAMDQGMDPLSAEAHQRGWAFRREHL